MEWLVGMHGSLSTVDESIEPAHNQTRIAGFVWLILLAHRVSAFQRYRRQFQCWQRHFNACTVNICMNSDRAESGVLVGMHAIWRLNLHMIALYQALLYILYTRLRRLLFEMTHIQTENQEGGPNKTLQQEESRRADRQEDRYPPALLLFFFIHSLIFVFMNETKRLQTKTVRYNIYIYYM